MLSARALVGARRSQKYRVASPFTRDRILSFPSVSPASSPTFIGTSSLLSNETGIRRVDVVWSTGCSKVRLTIVRPGFVHTRMTEGMRPAPLSTTPEAVALRQLRERLLPTPAETATISHEEMQRIRRMPPGREGGLASNPDVRSE